MWRESNSDLFGPWEGFLSAGVHFRVRPRLLQTSERALEGGTWAAACSGHTPYRGRWEYGLPVISCRQTFQKTKLSFVLVEKLLSHGRNWRKRTLESNCLGQILLLSFPICVISIPLDAMYCMFQPPPVSLNLLFARSGIAPCYLLMEPWKSSCHGILEWDGT